MSYKRNLLHDVTYWPVTGSDGFGGFLFGAPVLLKGRWEDKCEMFLSYNNEEEASQAIVYLGDDVDIGDWLAQGDYATSPTTNPTTLDNAYRIRMRNRTTDLRNVIAIRKVFL